MTRLPNGRVRSVLVEHSPGAFAFSGAFAFPAAASRPLCPSHPSRPLPAVLATCLPAHQVQDTGGNPSTFLSADWRVNARSAPQTRRLPGRPGGGTHLTSRRSGSHGGLGTEEAKRPSLGSPPAGHGVAPSWAGRELLRPLRVGMPPGLPPGLSALPEPPCCSGGHRPSSCSAPLLGVVLTRPEVP